MLEYFALGAILLSLTAIFYIFIFIHDLPHRFAKRRNHPQAEAIHYACWLSLFTLHAIWPLVFLWAVSNRGPIPVRITEGSASAGEGQTNDLSELRQQIAALQARLSALEQTAEKTHHA